MDAGLPGDGSDQAAEDGHGPDDAAAPGDEGDDAEGSGAEFAPEGEPVEGDALEQQWTDRALQLIPGGASTGSKQPAVLYGAVPDRAPTHYLRAHGCTLTTVAERTLLDCSMALGSVSLGYADEAVTRAVIEAVASGPVSGLAHAREVEVAARLAELIPGAERVRFLKSGAEAVAAAVRIARTATGRSQIVCCGYFGWHDWSSTGPGIPAGARADVHPVPFDDVEALEAAVARAGSDLAAVVLEPVIERAPSLDWLATARSLCDGAGAVFILDEMKTGFRLALAGYQEVAGVRADLSIYGKAMANGFPVAAVVGRADVMEAAARTWITSTMAGEAASLAAVMAVLDRYAEVDVCAALARTGAAIRESFAAAAAASGLPGVAVLGLDPMWFLRFADSAVESLFLQRAAESGLLVKRGPYNYSALAHDDEAVLLDIEKLASTAFVAVVEELEA